MKRACGCLCAVAVALAAAGCGDGGQGSTTATGPRPLDGDGLGAGAPPPIVAGQVTFENHCEVDLALFLNRASYMTLDHTGGPVQVPVTSLSGGEANVFMPYPHITDDQCPADFCDGWTALGGIPGTTQREGWMWEAPNLTYAAYCNPNLSGRGICAQQRNCCGRSMVRDGTFGTTWEITPYGGKGNDYIDLSTNYGYGPHDPPHLCPYPANPNNCVSAAANIFFNVPVRWWSNSDCSCTSSDEQVTSRECLEVGCPDAYQYPTDDKQCACSSGTSRGYWVEFCPPGSSMPAPPGA